MAIKTIADASSVKALLTFGVVLVTTTGILSTADQGWQRDFSASEPKDAAEPDAVGSLATDGEAFDLSVPLPVGTENSAGSGSARTAPARVVARPTPLDLAPFGHSEPPDSVPRVIDRYIGHVDLPSRLMDRVERLVKGDQALRDETPLLHDGTVFARQVSGDSDGMEIRVPLRKPLAQSGDLMLDIEQSNGKRHAVVISPSELSDESELRFVVKKRHLPVSRMQLRVFAMSSQMPLLVKGEVKFE